VHARADDPVPLGSGVLLDARRVLTAAHVVFANGDARTGLSATLPMSDDLMSSRFAVEQVVVPAGWPHDKRQDAAVLILREAVPGDEAARVRTPAAASLVDEAWWACEALRAQ